MLLNIFELKLIRFCSLLIISTNLSLSNFYELPSAKLELLSPKGFRISIPDDPGIMLFAFHGAINHQIKGSMPGDFSGEAVQPINGKWIYENQKIFLDPGDILYYWIHVQKENQIYRALDQNIIIPKKSSADIKNKENNIGYNQFKPDETEIYGTKSQMNCLVSKTTVRGRNTCKGELIFEDNFNTLNLTKWSKDVRIPLDSEDADFASFQSLTSNCYIKVGYLHIVPSLLVDVPGYNEERIRTGEMNLGSECTGIVDIQRECQRTAGLFRILPPIVSARIRTKEFFSFRYGKVEVRAKLPKGDWLFPQLFLEPFNNEYGVNSYASGQMRIGFIHGNEILETSNGISIDGSRLSGGVILTTGETNRDIWLKHSTRREHLGNNFHIYTLTWSDEYITLAIDNNEYTTLKGNFSHLAKTHNVSHASLWQSGNYMAPFDKEFFVTLGVSAGGISDFPDKCLNGNYRQTKPWSNTSPKAELKFWNDRGNWYKTWNGEDSGITVDYIRVWSL